METLRQGLQVSDHDLKDECCLGHITWEANGNKDFTLAQTLIGVHS